MRLRSSIAILSACAATAAAATDVNVIGLFPGKAVLVVDHGRPRTVSVGERTPEGVLLVGADSRGAVVEVDGRRETLPMGQHFETAADSDARQSVTLPADDRGQFFASGQVNGAHMRFMVDTGATSVLIPAAQAERVGLDYRRGTPGRIRTANGDALAWRVTLDSVSLGGITLYNVEGIVADSPGLNVALLGMTFLSRTDMRRDGAYMVLTKRY